MKKLIFSIFLLLVLACCQITNSIWHPHYTDKIQNFVTTKDGGQVAFLGEKFDYIFNDNNNVMKRLLFWANHDLLSIDTKNSKLQLDAFNNISGYVMVKTIVPNLKVKDVAYLESLGFIRGDKTRWLGKIFLSGKRYAKNPRNYKTYALTSEYLIDIYYAKGQDSNLDKAGKILISPITITIDAILWIGKKVIYDPS